MGQDNFNEYLDHAQRVVAGFVDNSDVKQYFEPQVIRDSALSYVGRPAKRLRPAVLLMACGSVSGPERESAAIPAAAGIELFHTWTLVHDDLIDNDSLRRGQPTVHESVTRASISELGLDEPSAVEYGRDIAVLTGDMQQGWAITAFIDCALAGDVDPVLILHLVRYLQSQVMGNLICGEVLDVQYGLQGNPCTLELTEDKIVHMLRLKTGVLYEFAGMAGALIGLNRPDFEDDRVRAIKSFAGKCGTAFQLQDDILGVAGDENTLGKPVGSDIREGKMTVIMCEALKNADDAQRGRILEVLGNRHADAQQVAEVTRLVQDLGGVARAKKLAEQHVMEAVPALDALDDSPYKRLLSMWADFMVNRRF